jgi:ankyrin repeat protein
MNYEELQQGIQDNLPIPNWEELWEAIENSNLEKYTPKQIKEGMLQDKHGWNLYHKASQNGHLDKIPKELLTAENLLKHDNRGWTCLPYAALNGHLDKIPKELLTAENLLKPNNYGYTCLHYAAMHGQLAEIPKELLTVENLLKTDTEGRTCLQYAARNDHLDKLPWLSYETLTELTAHFETQDRSKYKENAAILKTLNELLEKKLKKLEIIARSLTINHDTDIL